MLKCIVRMHMSRISGNKQMHSYARDLSKLISVRKNEKNKKNKITIIFHTNMEIKHKQFLFCNISKQSTALKTVTTVSFEFQFVWF